MANADPQELGLLSKLVIASAIVLLERIRLIPDRILRRRNSWRIRLV
jgi:hypothetical protein